MVPSGIGDVPVEPTGSYFNGVEVLVVLVSPGVPLLLLPAECVSVVLDGAYVGSSSGFGASGAKLTDLLTGSFIVETSTSTLVKSTGTPVTSTGPLLPVSGIVAVVLLGASVDAAELAFTVVEPPSDALVEYASVTSLSGLSILFPSGCMIGVVLGDWMRVRLCGVASC